MDAVHVEGGVENTIYSYVFELHNGICYLYDWHQFDEVVVLKVKEELTKKTATVMGLPRPAKEKILIPDMGSKPIISSESCKK